MSICFIAISQLMFIKHMSSSYNECYYINGKMWLISVKDKSLFSLDLSLIMKKILFSAVSNTRVRVASPLRFTIFGKLLVL